MGILCIFYMLQLCLASDLDYPECFYNKQFGFLFRVMRKHPEVCITKTELSCRKHNGECPEKFNDFEDARKNF